MSFRNENNNEVGLTRTQSSELDPQTSQSNSATGGKYVPPHVRNRVVKDNSRGNASINLKFFTFFENIFLCSFQLQFTFNVSAL